ncbi:hypothetical protein A4U49_06000 [Acidithiobacillus ferrivorans]|uniref:hypothetical protein n=1 Tax=Acidithiobacillus ferrivorans TaxID=160808 RepID=UPI000893B900|nr:hypothetical protein [Acidithiobacillus ferrivorans]OFA16730.1 hypothetical protein A4U49_06000 [Acidithiobacillus ferrivorans]
MTQKENTGMSIMGLLQDIPSTARTFVIDKGQSGDPLTTEQIKSALIAHEVRLWAKAARA